MKATTLDEHIEITLGVMGGKPGLAYYDHRAEIDESIRESQTFVNRMRQQIPSKLRPAYI